ncbi:MAG: hypothetical protein V4582_06635 [Pseudomonadota bacterium]
MPIVLVSALAIGLTLFLNVGKLDRTLGEVEQSRLRYTLNDLSDTLETGLDLGLPVKALGNAQAAIDYEAQQDPDIESISVIDETGALVFHTGAPDAAAFKPPAQIHSHDWVVRAPLAVTIGTKLSNNFGKVAGAVVLRYSAARHNGFVATISRQLGKAALAVLLATGLLLLAGIHMLVRRMQASLDTMEAVLEGAHGQVDGASDAAALARHVRQTAQAAQDDVSAVHQTLCAIEAGP